MSGIKLLKFSNSHCHHTNSSTKIRNNPRVLFVNDGKNSIFVLIKGTTDTKIRTREKDFVISVFVSVTKSKQC